MKLTNFRVETSVLEKDIQIIENFFDSFEKFGKCLEEYNCAYIGFDRYRVTFDCAIADDKILDFLKYLKDAQWHLIDNKFSFSICDVEI